MIQKREKVTSKENNQQTNLESNKGKLKTKFNGKNDKEVKKIYTIKFMFVV
jgi:hypothetical protein